MLVRRYLLLAAYFAPSIAQNLTGFNGTGVYNSSSTPDKLPWNTYNYCNAPHVNKAHWTPVEGAELSYVLAVMRHHKRTPDNLIPNESAYNPPSGWDCSNILAFNYAGPSSTRLTHTFSVPPPHPFASLLWNGTCDVGQLTRGGLDDARAHGEDFWGVYGALVGDVKSGMWVRTSPEERTMWVASALLAGMQPSLESLNEFVVHIQPSTIDSLVPDYPCPAADAVRNAYQSVPTWTEHLEEFAPLAAHLGDTLGTRGMDAWESWYDHYFDVFTSRTCNGHPLPCNATTGECVSEEDASTVHALGDFEYNYIWNAAQNASVYNSLTFGVFFSEIAMNFEALRDGTEPWRARVYVGHDGSMIRLATGLGLGKIAPLRWPALGSEIVMEVWKENKSGSRFVRVMHEGTPVPTLQRIALDDFIALLKRQVPEDVFGECMSAA